MLNKIFSNFRNGPVVLVSKRIEFTFPLSYGYLAGYLRHMGEDARVLFRPPALQQKAFVRQLMQMNPLLVGFGSLYPDLFEISNLVKMLNDAGRQFPIVIGGQMVTPIPKFAVEITGADFGVLGEGEITLYNLVMALREGEDPTPVKGLVIRAGNDFLFTGPGEYIEDLNKLPSIPHDLFPTEDWLHVGRWYTRYGSEPHWRFTDRVINVHGSRGCPFDCNFCYHHSRPRFRSMHVAIHEAAETLKRFNGNMLYFSDETTLPSIKRVSEMLEEIKSLPKRIEYSVSSRFDVLDKIDDSLLVEMKETGCRIMGLGIESGSDRILEIIGKRYSAETVRAGLERLKKVGILPTVSIMVGQYSETVEDVESSIALMKESVRSNRNIQYTFTITTPFPGSKLYALIFQKGYLHNDKEFYDQYFQSRDGVFKYVVNLSSMSDAELIAMYNKINKIYMQEKSKICNSFITKIEYLMRGIEVVHKLLDKKLFFNLRRKLKPKKYSYFYLLDKIQQLTYEFIQIKLDNLRLRLRGILVR